MRLECSDLLDGKARLYASGLEMNPMVLSSRRSQSISDWNVVGVRSRAGLALATRRTCSPGPWLESARTSKVTSSAPCGRVGE